MPEIDSHYLSEAAELFERQRGKPPSAASEDVAARIWAALGTGLPEELRGSAFWALGKRCQKEDKKRFVAALQHEVSRSSSVSYQIMIALDNLDEPVFAIGRSGASLLEAEQNLADAERYLAKTR
ncbi:MAG: hypothetical protein HZA31_06710 [Opitutae bacterium]|nr:hypothetical protein [Opitutae bacterium]